MLDSLGCGLRSLRILRLRAPRQRPAAGILDAEHRGAAAAPSAWPGAPLARRHQQRAQSRKAVGGYETQCYKLSETFFDLGSQEPRVEQLIEKRGAMLLDMLQHGLGVAGRLHWLGAARERCPECRIATREQRDRRRAHRRRATVGAGGARTQSRPGDASRPAAVVEPGRLIVGKPRRQELGLPGGSRCLEAFELPDHLLE